MTQLSKYLLYEPLGKGGYGIVYRAHDQALDIERAVKILHTQFAADPEFITRFRDEARLVAKLNHPNIVMMFDLGEAQGSYFLAMEYLSGGSLQQMLMEKKHIHLERAVEILDQIANALDYAHEQGLVHRDIKPGNILFDEKGDAHLVDFGFAKALQASKSLSISMSGTMVGTPAYISPEQFDGDPLDRRSDVYSLGVTFFEMLTGKLPFSGETPGKMIRQHLTRPVPRLDGHGVKAPAQLNPILARAMAKTPAERYPTAGAFAAAVKQAFFAPVSSPVRQKPIARPTASPYSILATRETPALVIYLLDASASMSLPFHGQRRMDVIHTALKQAIQTMVFRSTKGSHLTPRYRVAILSYNNEVQDLVGGVQPIDKLIQNELPEITPTGKTDTAQALRHVENLLQAEWSGLVGCPAPIICHMTDGIFTGDDPEPVARRLLEMKTDDGHVLIANIFLSDEITVPVQALHWPGITDRTSLDPEKYLYKLRNMSSVLPDSYHSMLKESGFGIMPRSYMLLPGNNADLIAMGFQMAAATPVQRNG